MITDYLKLGMVFSRFTRRGIVITFWRDFAVWWKETSQCGRIYLDGSPTCHTYCGSVLHMVVCHASENINDTNHFSLFIGRSSAIQ